MIDQISFAAVLKSYKSIFTSKQWPAEKYKWVAVKWFQDNWDVNATDFADMLTRSLSRTSNLLASANNYPARMITKFAEVAPEEVRAMFIELFDESEEVIGRIERFKMKSTTLLEKYGNGAGQHYQYENPISTYLWLRYPNKYYIFKVSDIKVVAKVLKSDYQFRKGEYSENIRNSLKLYDEICAELQKDDELKSLLQAQLTNSCYHDPELRTLTVDFGFYISHSYETIEHPEGWWPLDYSPELSVADWKKLLQDKTVFNTSSLEIMKRMKDYGGQATCTQLAVKYGENKNFYNTGSSALAKRVYEKTGCPVLKEDEVSRWWPILYIGKKADKEEEGSFVWKLREELAEALNQIDLSNVSLYALTPPGEERSYWWLNANPKIWSFSETPIGEVKAYTLLNDSGNKRRIYQNFLDAKAGDWIIGYESTPVKQVVAIGKISAKQDGKNIYFEKSEGLSTPIAYSKLKDCPELEHMEYFSSPQGSLFKLTKGEYEFIVDLIREENPLPLQGGSADQYTEGDFLKEVFMTKEKYDRLKSVLKSKKNVILQGAPGVGKTFAAKRLAYSLMGEKDENRIEFVQFHQNYAYEDFVMGYKPTDNGFELKYGIFYRFCQKAANQPDKAYFFIIDEINRGNMSKIFGELLMLIECDYRGAKTTLAYNGLSFSVPDNLLIIGMMNTADRSLAMIDYALRRRFSFFDMEPGFDSQGFVQYQQTLANDTFDELVNKIKDLNKEIALDKSLGKGFCIGHSYLCGVQACTEEWMKEVVEFEILPMLREYWFDDHAKVLRWENTLLGVFQ